MKTYEVIEELNKYDHSLPVVLSGGFSKAEYKQLDTLILDKWVRNHPRAKEYDPDQGIGPHFIAFSKEEYETAEPGLLIGRRYFDNAVELQYDGDVSTVGALIDALGKFDPNIWCYVGSWGDECIDVESVTGVSDSQFYSREGIWPKQGEWGDTISCVCVGPVDNRPFIMPKEGWHAYSWIKHYNSWYVETRVQYLYNSARYHSTGEGKEEFEESRERLIKYEDKIKYWEEEYRKQVKEALTEGKE